ncbi:MAG: hypothetical protein IJL42_09655 [Bacteroidales bacterium]|nr:hypothetical protein [Bacteroidales bacterium]
MRALRYILLALAVLQAALSCSTQSKLRSLQRGPAAASLALAREERLPEVAAGDLQAHRDTLTVTAPDGREMMIMRAVAPYYVSISQDIWYEDYKGESHQLTFYDGRTPSSEVVDLSGGWSMESDWQEIVDEGELRTIEINVNGFSASWRWGYLGNL